MEDTQKSDFFLFFSYSDPKISLYWQDFACICSAIKLLIFFLAFFDNIDIKEVPNYKKYILRDKKDFLRYFHSKKFFFQDFLWFGKPESIVKYPFFIYDISGSDL